MSSEPSQSHCVIPLASSPPEDNHMVTVIDITLFDPLYSRQFYCDEDILEELTTPDYPWDVLHHRALFLSQESFMPTFNNTVDTVECFFFNHVISYFGVPLQHCLTKGAYILASPKGLSLKEPVNGLYLKKFYT
jgi:hypothetical protein